MSSMRNAIQRRNHRERGQPEERKKLGLLEKHKDYSLRAADHNAKKKKLVALKQKILEKNPDEFYFGMLSRKGPSTGKKSNGKVSGDRGNEVLSIEAVRLLKTQDVGYVRTVRNTASKEARKLEEQLTLMNWNQNAQAANDDDDDEFDSVAVGNGKRRKTMYMEGEGDMELRVQEAKWEIEALDDNTLTLEEKNLRKLQRREREKVENKLETARERERVLAETERALESQRLGMGKSATRGGGTNKFGVKYKVVDRKR